MGAVVPGSSGWKSRCFANREKRRTVANSADTILGVFCRVNDHRNVYTLCGYFNSCIQFINLILQRILSILIVIWEVLLIAWNKFPSPCDQSEAPPKIEPVIRHQNGISTLAPQTLLHGETSDGVTKWRLFSQATSRHKAGGSTYLRQHLSVRTLCNWDSLYYFRNFKLFYTFLLQKLSNWPRLLERWLI